MAAKNTSTETTAADSETPLEDKVVVPHQKPTPKTEEIQEENIELSFKEKAKKALTNKKFVAGVASVVLIAAGAVLVKKRSESDETEDQTVSD